MRFRFGTRIIIFLIVVFIAVINMVVQSIGNILAGCTDQLLSRFKQSPVAVEYQNSYVSYLKEKETSFLYQSFNWSIDKEGDGCAVEGRAFGIKGVKSTTFIGDKFFINLTDKKIYPQSEGAKLLLDQYGGSVALP